MTRPALSPVPDPTTQSGPATGVSNLDTGAEQATVGALILAMPTVRQRILDAVRDDDFADPRCRFAVTTVRRMTAEGVPVDQVTLVGYVHRHALLAAGGPRVNLATWLAETCNLAPVPGSGTWYATAVVEASTRRKLAAAAGRIAAITEGGSVEEINQVVRQQQVVVNDLLGRLEVTAGGG